MFNRFFILGVAVLGVFLVVASLKWPTREQTTGEATTYLTPSVEHVSGETNVLEPKSLNELKETPFPLIPDPTFIQVSTQTRVTRKLDREAIKNFKQSLTETPSFVPPISAPFEFTQATQEQIEDHDKYADFEDNNRQRLKKSFVEAARVKIKQIDKLIEQGKRQGIEEHKLEEALQKREAIADLMRTLAAELIP